MSTINHVLSFVIAGSAVSSLSIIPPVYARHPAPRLAIVPSEGTTGSEYLPAEVTVNSIITLPQEGSIDSSHHSDLSSGSTRVVSDPGILSYNSNWRDVYDYVAALSPLQDQTVSAMEIISVNTNQSNNPTFAPSSEPSVSSNPTSYELHGKFLSLKSSISDSDSIHSDISFDRSTFSDLESFSEYLEPAALDIKENFSFSPDNFSFSREFPAFDTPSDEDMKTMDPSVESMCNVLNESSDSEQEYHQMSDQEDFRLSVPESHVFDTTALVVLQPVVFSDCTHICINILVGLVLLSIFHIIMYHSYEDQL